MMAPMKLDMPANTAITVKIHHKVISILVGFSLKSCCCFKKSFTVILFKNWFFLSIKQVFFLYSSIFWYLFACFQTSISFFSLLSKYNIFSVMELSICTKVVIKITLSSIDKISS